MDGVNPWHSFHHLLFVRGLLFSERKMGVQEVFALVHDGFCALRNLLG
jgi:hypothetical protein